MLNQNQDILPYAYNMQNDLPRASGVPNSAIPSLASNMMNPLINSQSFMPSGNQPGYAHGGLVRYIQSMQDSRFTQPHSQFAHGGLAHLISSMMDSRFTQPHSQYSGGGQVLDQPTQHQGLTRMAQMAEELRQAGTPDGDSILAHINPQEAQMLAAISGGPSTNPHTMLPSYKFHIKPKSILKAVVPVVGSVIGGMLGGPGGAAIGGGLGAAVVSKKKNRLANAALGAIGGYTGAGGFGELHGLGNLIPTGGKTLSGTLGKFIPGMGSTAARLGPNMMHLTTKPTDQSGNPVSAFGLNQFTTPLLGGALLGTAFGKTKTPKDAETLTQHVRQKPKWGPEHQPKNVKPLNRVMRKLHPEDEQLGERLFFEEANPEIEYYSHGGYTSPGYLHGATGGQDDKIKAELSDGEYVISADVVSRLGDGNNAHGAKKLDHFMRNVRMHTNSKDGKLQPKSKGIEHYLHKRSA